MVLDSVTRKQSSHLWVRSLQGWNESVPSTPRGEGSLCWRSLAVVTVFVNHLWQLRNLLFGLHLKNFSKILQTAYPPTVSITISQYSRNVSIQAFISTTKYYLNHILCFVTGSHCIAQTSLKICDPPAPALQTLGRQECASIPCSYFISFHLFIMQCTKTNTNDTKILGSRCCISRQGEFEEYLKMSKIKYCTGEMESQGHLSHPCHKLSTVSQRCGHGE